jgi:hypothetical protein
MLMGVGLACAFALSSSRAAQAPQGPSFDSKLKDLYASPGYRYIYCVDDAQGHRLLNQEGHHRS